MILAWEYASSVCAGLSLFEGRHRMCHFVPYAWGSTAKCRRTAFSGLTCSVCAGIAPQWVWKKRSRVHSPLAVPRTRGSTWNVQMAQPEKLLRPARGD